MKTFKKKCKDCGVSFSSNYNHSKYCEQHRKNEKTLKPLSDTPRSCPVCNKLLVSMDVGLDKMVTKLDESYIEAKKKLDHSRKIRKVQEPPDYDRYIERFSRRDEIAKGLYKEDIISIKGLIEESEYSESTIKRHIHQHLIPSEYIKKVGKGFTIGTGFDFSLPRFLMNYKEDEVYWSQNIGYFGLNIMEIKQQENEFEKINNDLQLISEQISILWIKTRFIKLKKFFNMILRSKSLEVEEKAVIFYGIKITLRPCIKNVLSEIAPTLSKQGKDLSYLDEYINDVDKILISDDKKMMKIEDIADDLLNNNNNPLLHESWVHKSINYLIKEIMKILGFDTPIILIDRKIGPRSAKLNESS